MLASPDPARTTASTGTTEDPASEQTTRGGVHAAPRRIRRRLWLAMGGVLILVAGASAVGWMRAHPSPTAYASRALDGATGDPTVPPSAGPSASATPSAAPSRSASPSPAARAGTASLRCKARPSACGFPDATNTGIPLGTKLQAAVDSMTITKSGEYSGLNVRGGLTVKANHVVVRNSHIGCVGGTCVALDGTYDTIMDSEIGGGAGGHDYTGAQFAVYSGGTSNTNKVLRVNMHDTDDGMRMDGGTTLQDSWIHDLTSGINGSHSDGVQSCGGSGMAFLHNTIWGGNNDPLFLQGGDCGSNDANPLRDVTVDDNLLLCLTKPGNGSSYGISVGRAYNVSITNNHFDRGWEVVPVGTFLPNSLSTFSGNVYDDSGTTIAHP